MTANYRKRANVSGMIVGLLLTGSGALAFIIDRRSVSPRAAARALCLSGSPLGFFCRLHLSVVRIFHIRLFVVFSK